MMAQPSVAAGTVSLPTPNCPEISSENLSMLKDRALRRGQPCRSLPGRVQQLLSLVCSLFPQDLQRTFEHIDCWVSLLAARLSRSELGFVA